MKNRYELALDAAAVEMGYNDYHDSRSKCVLIDLVHTRAAEIFAMGFKEWTDRNGWRLQSDKIYMKHESQYSSILETKTESELLTLYNQSA